MPKTTNISQIKPTDEEKEEKIEKELPRLTGLTLEQSQDVYKIRRLAMEKKQSEKEDSWITDQHQENLRMKALKLAVSLLEEHLKESPLSPRDNSLEILWELSDLCYHYCTNKN